MPYITTERVAEIRKELKQRFPGVTFSVRKRHHSVVDVAIMQSPYKWSEDNHHFSFNCFYLDKYEHADFLKAVHEIMDRGNYIVSEDGDYGSIPKFYTNLSWGRWNKPPRVRQPITV